MTAKRDVRLVLHTTPQVLEALRTLVKTGMFGFSVEQTAEELLRAKMRDPDISEFVFTRNAAERDES